MLRPDFTKLLFKRLKDGDSINLIGQSGMGCTECLQDIQLLAIQEGITTIYLDFKRFKFNYDGLVKEARIQLLNGTNQEIDPKNLLENEGNTFAIAISESKPKIHQLFILLDHYDDILDNPLQKIPKSFFDDLNSLKNREHVSVCCVTEKPHRQYKFYFKDEENGKILDGTSWLDLKHRELPRLSDEEILAFLIKKLSKHPIFEKEKKHFNQYIELLRGHQAPINLIEVLESNWDQFPNEMPINKRLKRITGDYKSRYNTRPREFPKWATRFLDKAEQISNIWKNIRVN